MCGYVFFLVYSVVFAKGMSGRKESGEFCGMQRLRGRRLRHQDTKVRKRGQWRDGVKGEFVAVELGDQASSS